MKTKRLLSLILSVCMVLSLVLPAAHANGTGLSSQVLDIEKLTGFSADLFQNDGSSGTVLDQEILDANEEVPVIIVMEGDSVIEADSSAVLDEETQEKMEELAQAQTNVVSEIEDTILDGESLQVSYTYTWLLNAVAATVPYGSIAAIEALDGVKQVVRQQVYYPCETDSTQESYDPLTISDGVMIGRETTWAEGYTGAGIKIAIIDTGIDSDHPNFEALPEDVPVSATRETISEVLSSLNASDRYGELTVDDVYYSSKIAFGFNYCDNSLDITHDNDTAGEHGTHVAGIAAANKVEGSDVVGVAPDAQLYVMKVFGKNGGAYEEDILAALEDALLLGADVINMSLGSSSGFSSSGDSIIDAAYAKVSATGTILSVAAGNAYTAGLSNAWGTDENLTVNVDNATIASPATYTNALSVASVENLAYPSDSYITVNGSNFIYNDGSNGANDPLSTLAGKELQVVAVPGYGEESDYEGLDVTGKIALVQRGSITFIDKCTYAEGAGAIACLVYNNVSGEFGMDLTDCEATIPCASISQEAGAFILAALEENPALTVIVGKEATIIPNELAYQMSDFSSWGVSPDLSLTPDITAPGGNIYSTVDGGGYDLMSGTSMAAPNVAGISALVLQYVKETYGLSGTELHSFVSALLMSTAAPLQYDDSLYYSPRQQGSGLANAFAAVSSGAYLSVDGSDTPKAELGDDPDRSGNYSFSFNVTNFGESPLFYEMSTVAQSEGVDETYADEGLYFMSSTPVGLNAAASESSDSMAWKYDVDDSGKTGSHDAYWIYQAAVAGTPCDENWTDVEFRYNTDGCEGVTADDVQAYLEALVGNDSPTDLSEQVLKVAAGGSATVEVCVDLDEADKEYFETYYPNGCYVEGYTFLTALNAGGTDLSLPYLGFYGDWTKAPVLDTGYYWDDEDELVYSQYINVIYANYDYYGYEYYTCPGENPYAVDEDIDLSHISLSPNGDGYADYISEAYLSLLRNAATLSFTYTDAETGEVYFNDVVTNTARKSTYQSSYGEIIPYVYSWYNNFYYLTDADGNYLPNNTKLKLTISAAIDYEGAEPDVWEIPITVDTEAPELLEAVMWSGSNGVKKLELTFRDNLSVAAVNLLDSTGTRIYGQYAVEDVEPKDGYQTYHVEYDITDCADAGKLIILLGDYAYNESAYALNLNGEGSSYGDLVGFQYDEDGGYGTWVSFDEDVNEDEIEMFLSELDFACAEYVGGMVYAQTEDGKLYGFSYADMLNNTLLLDSTYITTLENVYQDLAYSYYDGKLYGLYTYEYERWGETSATSYIYSINIKGEYFDEDLWSTVEPYQEDLVRTRGGLYGLGLACDDEGSLYILGTVNIEEEDPETGEIGTTDSTAQLWKASWEVDDWDDTYIYLGAFTKIGDTGLGMDYRQSIAWDHNTETLYWAQFYPENLITLQSQLVEIDPNTAEATVLGTLSGETGCLFAPLNTEAAAKEAHQNIPEYDLTTPGAPTLNPSTLTLTVGGSQTLTCTFDPWYSQNTAVTWTSSDDTVATVDENGTVTGVSAGSCTVTVSSVADPALTDSCAVSVSALSLSIQGTVSYTSGGVNNVGNSSLYCLNMEEGAATMTVGSPITASVDLNYGLQLGAATLAKGSMWACEYGNTGMIYQIDPDTGVVQDVYQPIDGDVMFGLTYSENTGMFTGIMNYYLYVDLPMTHEMYAEMLESYDEATNQFTWHRLNISDYLKASDEGFNTGESGYGSIVDVVLCGITTIDQNFDFSYNNKTLGNDYYKDYLGNWAWDSCSYTSDVTYVLLDNVGRLWYMDEITGLYGEDEYGEMSYFNEDGSAYISGSRNGVIAQDNGDGTYNVFYLRKVVETPLTDMYRAGTMPRYTYHFSDLYYAGVAPDGSDMFLMSLYDYWNNGTSNEFYLYLSGATKFDEKTEEIVKVSDEMLYDLGSAGNGNIVATITKATVTGGLPSPTSAPEEGLPETG